MRRQLAGPSLEGAAERSRIREAYAMPSFHSLASARELRLADLANENFIVLPRKITPVPRLVELVRLVARQAAQEFVRAESERSTSEFP